MLQTELSSCLETMIRLCENIQIHKQTHKWSHFGHVHLTRISKILDFQWGLFGVCVLHYASGKFEHTLAAN